MAQNLRDEISRCRICAKRFAGTATRHAPRPVVWFRSSARILIAGQAPGLQVHEKGKPFQDRSGVRLRHWMGVNEEEFYDAERIAIVPMAFCFPGYTASGSDLRPPKVCAATWRNAVMAHLGAVPLILLVGGHAQEWHLGAKGNVTQIVSGWRDLLPGMCPLPHPSWRNNAWLKRNPWFSEETLPALRERVREVLA